MRIFSLALASLLQSLCDALVQTNRAIHGQVIQDQPNYVICERQLKDMVKLYGNDTATKRYNGLLRVLSS